MDDKEGISLIADSCSLEERNIFNPKFPLGAGQKTVWAEKLKTLVAWTQSNFYSNTFFFFFNPKIRATKKGNKPPITKSSI